MRGGKPLRLSKLERLHIAKNRIRKGPPGFIPLADLALILFTVYLSQAPFVLQPGIAMTLPSAPFAFGSRFGRLTVTVTRDGLLFFNDERVKLHDLAARFREAAALCPDEPLVVQADGFVQNYTLVQIYNMAAEAGIRDVTLATREAPGRRPSR